MSVNIKRVYQILFILVFDFFVTQSLFESIFFVRKCPDFLETVTHAAWFSIARAFGCIIFSLCSVISDGYLHIIL